MAAKAKLDNFEKDGDIYKVKTFKAVSYTHLDVYKRQISSMLDAIYLAAEPNPGVWSVMHRSLSMVFGIPIIFTSLLIFFA